MSPWETLGWMTVAFLSVIGIIAAAVLATFLLHLRRR